MARRSIPVKSKGVGSSGKRPLKPIRKVSPPTPVETEVIPIPEEDVVSSEPVKPSKIGSVIKFVIIGLVVGIIFSSFGEKAPVTTDNDSNADSTTGRVRGNALLNELDEIDSELIPANISGQVVDRTGGVVSLETENYTAYLVIPNGVLNTSQYVELAEYAEMPATATHTKLFTTYGYGLNVLLSETSYELDYPLYLVMDFSKGAVWDKWASRSGTTSYCKYTSSSFNVDACATLLGVDASSTHNPKYMSVTPQFGGDDSTPTFPVYSYYLGEEQLLVNRIDETIVLVPQPLDQSLVQNVIVDTFKGYSVDYEKSEAIDLLSVANLSKIDSETAYEIVSTKPYPVEIKSAFSKEKILELYNLKKNKFGDGVLLTEEEITKNFDSISLIEEMIRKLSLGDARSNTVAKVAVLRRIYSAGIIDIDSQLIEVLDEFNYNRDYEIYADHEYPYALLSEGIFRGKGEIQNKVYSYLLKIKAGSDFDGEAEDSNDDWERDAGNAAEGAYEDASATAQEMVEWAALADMLGDDELADAIKGAMREEVRRMGDAAQTDEEITEAAQACLAVLSYEDCKDIMKKFQDVVYKHCMINITSKNLGNFAVQDEVTCREISGM